MYSVKKLNPVHILRLTFFFLYNYNRDRREYLALDWMDMWEIIHTVIQTRKS